MGQTRVMTAHANLRALDDYASTLARLTRRLDAGEQDVSRLLADARSLVTSALPLLDEVARQVPECGGHFTLLADAVLLLDSLPPAALERAWEHNGSMPPAPAICEDAQQLVMAPARVASRLQQVSELPAPAPLRARLQALEEALPRLRALFEAGRSR
jgi:hypothetical protein